MRFSGLTCSLLLSLSLCSPALKADEPDLKTFAQKMSRLPELSTEDTDKLIEEFGKFPKPMQITLLAAMSTKGVQAAAAAGGVARRDAHPKAHGCVKAKFTVLDVPLKAHKVGLFVKPGTYAAWVRFSNGAGKLQADGVPDGRGMAIKVLGIPEAGPRQENPRSPKGNNQDFIMINNPSFFVANLKDYFEFFALGAQNRSLEFLKRHPLEASVISGIQNQFTSSPTDTRYFSQVPYAFGEKGAMKYSAVPCYAKETNYLRNQLLGKLQDKKDNKVCFHFQVQARGDESPMAAKTPVENPVIQWQEAVLPFTDVAKIEIPEQAVEVNDKLCENLSFTPANGLAAFRPLGDINVSRVVIYDEISKLRHAINKEDRLEPKAPENVDEWLKSK